MLCQPSIALCYRQPITQIARSFRSETPLAASHCRSSLLETSLATPSLLCCSHSHGLFNTRKSDSYYPSTSTRHLCAMPAWRSARHPSGPRPNDAKSGPEGEPMTPILSASLIVLSASSSCASSSSSPTISTLMLQRSSRVGSSFRSASVWPGGALDLADEAAVGCRTELATQNDPLKDAEYLEALQLCALRETFEETGLILVPSSRRNEANSKIPWSRAVGWKEAGMDEQSWQKKRDQVHSDAAYFADFLREIGNRIGASDDNSLPIPTLTYHSHWITPRGVVRPGKRFSAHFFLTVLDSPLQEGSESPINLTADGTETLSLRIAPPDEFIAATLDDALVLYPPQFYILCDLSRMMAGSGDFEARVRCLQALNFDDATKVTPVEEEPRYLSPGQNYAWDRNTSKPTGWVASWGGRVTAVEPRAFPRRGSVITSDKVDGENENAPFIFPLVLPGDHLASSQEQNAARQCGDTKLSSELPPLNRVYVSPRSLEDGGGLYPRGAVRRGIGSLKDWRVGASLEHAENFERDRDISKL